MKLKDSTHTNMSQHGLGAVGGCATTATKLIIFYLSTCLLSLAADAQEKEKAPRRVEPWSYLERMGEAEHDEKNYQAIASTALGARRVATVGKADGKFNISVWHVSYAGNVARLTTYEDDTEVATEAKIATLPDQLEMNQAELPDKKILLPFGHRFVTVTRAANQTLKLTVWEVNPNGDQITKRGSGHTMHEIIHSGFAIAVFSRSRVVTAVRDVNDHLKLISWHISVDGLVERLHDVTGNEAVAEIAMATYDSYPPDEQRLATVVRTKSGKTKEAKTTAGKVKITSWRVTEWKPGDMKGPPIKYGQFTELASAEGGDVWQVAAATLSHRRIVTAIRNSQFELEVQTWDFDAQGKVSLHSGAKAGEIKTTPDVTTQGGARVITSVLDGEGRLTLITWDAIDNVVRLDHARSDPMNDGSIVPLGADWIATTVLTKESTLKVIAWREHGVSLLHGEWPLSSTKPVTPSTEESPSRPDDETVIRPARIDEDLVGETIRDGASNKPFHPSIPPASVEPRIDSPDAIVAVGFNYFIVSNTTKIEFFDKKKMERLESKNGEPTKLTIDSFFSTFTTGTRARRSRNEQSINRHLALPPAPPNNYPPYHTCDPDPSPPPLDPDASPTPLNPCISEFFDTRIYFQPTGPSTGRFFVAAETRPDKTIDSSGRHCDQTVKAPCDPQGCCNINYHANQLNRRYFAFAVSKTEDPRDGFYQWMTTEPHLFDWPLLTVKRGGTGGGVGSGGILAIAATVDPQRLNVSPFGMKPSVYLFALKDLLDGRRYPRSHKLFIREAVISDPYAEDGKLVPLTHYGDSANRMFFVQMREWKGKPPPWGDPTPGWWPVSMVNVYSFLHPSDWKNFPPIERTGAFLKFSLENPFRQNATFRDGKIYLAGTAWVVDEDTDIRHSNIRVVRIPLTNLTTKPQASLSPSDGYLHDVFGFYNPNDPPGQIVHYDWPSITANKDGHIVIVYRRKNPIEPEARYSVLLAGEQRARPSNLLRKGDCKGGTLGGYFHFQTAVVDPADDQTVWMAAFFAHDKDGKCSTTNDQADRIVVGRMKP